MSPSGFEEQRMRLANIDGRSTMVTDLGLIDIEIASQGRFASSPTAIFSEIDALQDWFATAQPDLSEALDPESLLGSARLGAPVPEPEQIFSIGLNYRTHAEEMGLPIPTVPMVFTKFRSCLAGPYADLALPAETVDWEAELVVVIGQSGREIKPDNALKHVAGYCSAQDYSERVLQLAASPPQFSLGKSYEAFAPMGPWITTADEVPDPQKLSISCEVDGKRYQEASTADMVFSVAELIVTLSAVCELRAGDLIYTGSPAGVGQGQEPPVFLSPGSVVTTEISGLGRLRNHCVPARA